MQIKVVVRALANDAVNAWRFSRDQSAAYNPLEIMAVDAPVIEMPSALLHFIDFTIVEREIFCSLRNHTVWARTSRVDDPTLFTVPKEFQDEAHDYYRADMLKLRAKGVDQDQWRLLLPVVAHTSWTARMHVRDMAKLVHYFKYLAQECFVSLDQCGRFNAVALCLTDTLTNMLGPDITHALLTSAKLAKYLNEDQIVIEHNNLWNDSHFQTVEINVPLGLRAQIVRHRELQFVDNLMDLIKSVELPTVKLIVPIAMVIIARKDVWRSVMSKRLCWIAQHDIWAHLTKLFPASALPCADGSCPYRVDVQARMQGKDPGCPCPRYCNLYAINKEPWLERMHKEAWQRGGKLWQKELVP
jgi:hypothetical protein